MTRRQSNSQWSGGIVAHPAPKKSFIDTDVSKEPRCQPAIEHSVKTQKTVTSVHVCRKLTCDIFALICISERIKRR